MDKEKKQDEAAQLKLDYLKMKSALVDKNTDLSSFHLYFDEVRTFLDKKRFVGIIHLEISNLTIIESLYGWQIFERILKKVSKRLQELKGKIFSDKSIIAMNGAYGDRFVLLLPETNDGLEITPEYLLDLTERIQTGLSGEFSSDEYTSMAARLGFNLGCATIQESPYHRLERLIYQAVEEARSMPLRREERRMAALSSELKMIINTESILTVFQNIVDIEKMEVFGYEAFSRGPKDSTFEKPGMMFAVSSKIGLSAELDRVCRKVALKNAEGMPSGLKLFINSLPISISDPDWMSGGIDELLWKIGMRSEDLVIEIPERYYSENASTLTKEVHLLKERGIAIAIDDIGTGYSSFQTIMDLQPDYVKIDASLIRDIDAHLIKQELLGSLLHIARNIGACIIAEGVETSRELETLKKAGIRYAQGYYFSYPAQGIQLVSKNIVSDH